MGGAGRGKGSEVPGKGKGPIGWVNFAVTGFILVVLYLSYEYAKVRGEKDLLTVLLEFSPKGFQSLILLLLPAQKPSF